MNLEEEVAFVEEIADIVVDEGGSHAEATDVVEADAIEEGFAQVELLPLSQIFLDRNFGDVG